MPITYEGDQMKLNTVLTRPQVDFIRSKLEQDQASTMDQKERDIA